MWRYCNGQAECETGKSNYYAWLNKLGLDDTKAYQRPQEKFSWTEPYIQFLKEDEQAKYFKVEALFPITSMNNNVYTKDELLQAARSLVGKTVDLNHTDEKLPEVTIYDAQYEDNCVECLLRVAKESKALGMIEKGEILQVSIEADCLRGREQTPEGNVCHGLIFTGLALLTKDILAGVPLTRIMPVEKLVESFTVTSVTSLDEKQKEDPSEMKNQKPVEDSALGKTPQTGTNVDFQGKIADLETKYEALKNELEGLKKPTQESKKEPCKCVLTKEGFWARFHQLRSEGASKSEAFRLVSLEVIEAATKKSV
jgi:hypothetical protein